MYFTDRGIEELVSRRGEEDVTLAWLSERLVEFVDLNPEFETATVVGSSRNGSTARVSASVTVVSVPAPDLAPIIQGGFPFDDHVVETVGEATWKDSLAAVKPGGRVTVCGATSGPTTVPIWPLIANIANTSVNTAIVGPGQVPGA